mmetsp:Transcript_9453/g.29248  ORF Transcript_9453/g.29248 Transcript_9453/m.29248 type:complete len:206 (-) Transcript_9453:1225-1842(-)
MSTQLPFFLVRELSLHELDSRLLRVEEVKMMLSEVADTNLRVADHLTLPRLEQAQAHLDERGFTRAVRANKCKSGIAIQTKVDIVEQALRVAEFSVDDLKIRRLCLVGVREIECGGTFHHHRGDALDAFDCLHPRLCHFRPVGVALETVDKGLHVSDFALLRFECALLLLELFKSRCFESVVVTFVVLQLVLIKVHDLGADCVQE